MTSTISTINIKKFVVSALILSFFMCYSVIAQGGGSAATGRQQGRILQLDELFGKVKQGYKQGNIDIEKIKGSPYLSKEFAKGLIYHENKPIGKLFMRYNTFSDEIEIKKNATDTEYSALIKISSVQCDVNNQTIVYSNYKPINEASKDGYLVTLTNKSNSYVLCKRVRTIFKDRGVEPGNSLSKAIEAKFATFVTYYALNTKTNKAEELSKKQKKIVEAFPEQDSSAISSFIKDQKINTKKEADLIKLFNHINSLESKS